MIYLAQAITFHVAASKHFIKFSLLQQSFRNVPFSKAYTKQTGITLTDWINPKCDSRKIGNDRLEAVLFALRHVLWNDVHMWFLMNQLGKVSVTSEGRVTILLMGKVETIIRQQQNMWAQLQISFTES